MSLGEYHVDYEISVLMDFLSFLYSVKYLYH